MKQKEKGVKKDSRKERMKKLRDLIVYLSSKKDWEEEENIKLYYMYYDRDNEVISDRWNGEFVY